MKLNGMPCIEADDILLFDPGSGLGKWANTISGSFTYPSGQTPCSIMINKGVDLFSSACHSWLGFPETVLYRYKDGSYGIGKFKNTSEIPNRSNVLWAVGGMGLIDKYNPAEEGFSKFVKNGKSYNYSDVLRLTSHTLIGIKNNKVYLVYVPLMSGSQVNQYAIKCGFEKSIMLDGGHISAINSADVKKNLNTVQGYAIQGVSANFAPTEPVKKKIILDAGHNALNRSNRSADGTYIEADFNLEMVELIEPHINRCGIDTEFIDVLNASQSIELNELVKKIDASNGDVLLSIHSDANSKVSAKGQTIYDYKLEGESHKLAQAIHEATVPSSEMEDRGIRDGSNDIRVIFAPRMPCVLIECGFHTNLDDLAKLKSKVWKEKMAVLIAKGVVNYFGMKWVEPIVIAKVCPTCGRPY